MKEVILRINHDRNLKSSTNERLPASETNDLWTKNDAWTFSLEKW